MCERYLALPMTDLSPKQLKQLKTTSKLRPTERIFLLLFGFVLLATAAIMLIHPPKRHKEETVTEAPSYKTTVEEHDLAPMATAAMIAGLVFILVAINGIRFSHFSFAGVGADADQEKEEKDVAEKTFKNISLDVLKGATAEEEPTEVVD